jgi:hypothetical protein
MECPNCHNANKYKDYEGPTCEVCGGAGTISPPVVEIRDGNPQRRCAHGKLFTESCEGCGYIHPRDR